MKKVEQWATPRFASVLSRSDNRWICGFATLRPNLLMQASHIPKTLSEIAGDKLKEVMICQK